MTLRILILVACLLPLAGCGKGVQRQGVSGSVTLDGKPIAKGTILFTPLAGGPSAGGDIVAGRYELTEERGPGLGKYRVEINAWRAQGTTSFDTATGAQDQLLVSMIPAQYNTASKLEREITEGRSNRLDFDLKTK